MAVVFLLLFFVCVFAFLQIGGTSEYETTAKLIPKFFCVQNKDSAELTLENTFKENVVRL